MLATIYEFLVGVPHTTNSTCSALFDGERVCLSTINVPSYFALRQNLFDAMPDNILAVVAPVVSYWIMALLFHLLDTSNWSWLEKYRIHESAEVTTRNRATRTEVLSAVVFQHLLQTALGYYWVSSPPEITLATCKMEMEAIGKTLASLIRWTAGQQAANQLLSLRGDAVIHWVYWWVIPVAQIFFSLFIVDTWQYFLHRGMHVNKFLYRHLHSVHHRLYVPYAYGALYNHPLEGFFLDSIGAVVAETLANLSVRQTVFLFAFSSMKTVDDHCGYRLPFDPFQMLTGNNADYHDIHHQTIGIKSNFAQPFFVHWDIILGTRMTRKEIEERKQKVKTT